MRPHSNWLVVGDSPRGPRLGRHGFDTGFHTVLSKSVGFFIINIFFKRKINDEKVTRRFDVCRNQSLSNIFLIIKNLSNLKSGKCWTRLSPYPLLYENYKKYKIIRRFATLHLRGGGTGQYSETQERWSTNVISWKIKISRTTLDKVLTIAAKSPCLFIKF